MTSLDRILTLRQPWATAVISYGKDVENRSWETDYRGRLWIHAGQASDLLPEYLAIAEQAGVDHRDIRPLLSRIDDDRGSVIGHVDLIDIVRDSDSPWAARGQFHWLLGNPVRLDRPFKRRGKQGLGYFSIEEVPSLHESSVLRDEFVNSMIAKHGRYEMLYRYVIVYFDDTLFMEDLLEPSQYATDGKFCAVPVVEVLWARACLEGLYSPTNSEPGSQ